MAIPTDQVDYNNKFAEQIKIVLDRYKEYLEVKKIWETDSAFIANYPAISIELDNVVEEWKSMPRQMLLTATYLVTWYYQQMDETILRTNIRKGLSRISAVLRENWNLNGFCSRNGTTVMSEVPYILAVGEDLIAGGVITLECRKVITVTIVP